MVCDRIQVIGMHRLSEFLHHIIGDIYQIIDRADPDRRQSSLHPLRGRPDLDILYYSCTISRTKFLVFHRYLDIIIHIFRISRLRNDRRMEFFSESRRRFPRDPDHAETVDPVGCNLIFEHHIVKPQRFHRIRPDFCILRKDIDAFFRRLRIHIFVRSQFLDRAHHAPALYAAQFPLLDLHASCHTASRLMPACHASAVQHNRHLIAFFHIIGARDDLDSLFSHVDLTDDQFISIRMLLYLIDLPDHDLIQIRIQYLVSFYFCS